MRLQAIPPFRRRIRRLVPVTVYYGGCSALNYTGVGRFRSGAQANAPASTDNPGRRASDWYQPNAAPGGLPVIVNRQPAKNRRGPPLRRRAAGRLPVGADREIAACHPTRGPHGPVAIISPLVACNYAEAPVVTFLLPRLHPLSSVTIVAWSGRCHEGRGRYVLAVPSPAGG